MLELEFFSLFILFYIKVGASGRSCEKEDRIFFLIKILYLLG